MLRLSPERVKEIEHVIGRATLSGCSPQERQAALDNGVDLSALNLRGRQKFIRAVAQLQVEATETNYALRMEDDL